MGFCLRSRASGDFSVVGCLPCLLTVPRVLANSDSTSSLRSITLILLGQSMLASIRPWFTLLVSLLLRLLLMLLFAPLRLWRSVSKHSLVLLGVWLMGSQSLWDLKEPWGMLTKFPLRFHHPLWNSLKSSNPNSSISELSILFPFPPPSHQSLNPNS